ncbi:MAG: biopolymer transporter ExbD [candidate division KSB1 bacterium]|nr:biopolymer transporter ExbD [candidate division KSB1 bacterium]
MDFRTTRKPMVVFSAISFTDIVLLLLIFFLLSSSYVVQPGIKVRLPKAVSGQVDQSNRIFLTVTRDERIFLNTRQVSLAQLGGELRKLLDQGASKVVVIRADKDLSLERAIQIVDIAKLAGGEQFLIATQPGM